MTPGCNTEAILEECTGLIDAEAHKKTEVAEKVKEADKQEVAGGRAQAGVGTAQTEASRSKPIGIPFTYKYIPLVLVART